MKYNVIVLIMMFLTLCVNAKTIVLLDSTITKSDGRYTAKEEYEYNEYGKEISDVWYAVDTNGDLVPEGKIKTNYHDMSTGFLRYNWDATCDCWRQNYHKRVTFDDDSLILSIYEENIIDTDDKYDTTSKTAITYTYNAKRMVTEILTKKGTTLESSMTYSKKNVYTYNSHDSLATATEYSYQNKTWVGNTKVANSYKDTLGQYRLVLQTMPKWNTITKDFTTNQLKITYSYSEDGSWIKTIFAYALGKWYEAQKEVFYYEDGLLAEYDEYKLDTETAKLYLSAITDYSYDANGNLLSSIKGVYYSGQGWCNFKMEEYTYDEAGNCVEFHSWTGDDDPSVWKHLTHYTQTFDEYGNILTHTSFTSAGEISLVKNYYYSAKEIQEETTTDIDDSILYEYPSNSQIYDILGRPINHSYHGVVIYNGRKYFQ